NIIDGDIHPRVMRRLERYARARFLTIEPGVGAFPSPPADGNATSAQPLEAAPGAPQQPAAAPPAVEIPEGMGAACPVLPPAPPKDLVPCVDCYVRAGYSAE